MCGSLSLYIILFKAVHNTLQLMTKYNNNLKYAYTNLYCEHKGSDIT